MDLLRFNASGSQVSSLIVNNTEPEALTAVGSNLYVAGFTNQLAPLPGQTALAFNDPNDPAVTRGTAWTEFLDKVVSSKLFVVELESPDESLKLFVTDAGGELCGYEPLSSFEDGDTPLMREISHGYFEVLGVQPLLGRTFLEEEDRPGGASVLILSYELWQRRFGGDPGVVGRTTELDGRPCEIVGVRPQDYGNIVWGLNVPPQAWLPLALAESGLDRRGNAHLVFARLKDDVAIGQAQVLAEVGGDLCDRIPLLSQR